MKEQIANSLDNPKQLELLYRANKSLFKREFQQLYREVEKTPVVEVWSERLKDSCEEISWGSTKEVKLVAGIVLLGCLLIQLPNFFQIEEEFFYTRNIGLIVFSGLTIYFAWKYKVSGKVAGIGFATLVLITLYMNLLPAAPNSDTVTLASLHVPLLLWTLMGIMFVGGDIKSYFLRLEFLKCNGDQLVMTGLIIIAGALMSAATIALFSLIEVRIEDYYFRYVGICGLVSAPIVATFLVRTNPHLVSRVSPVIAKIFTPLVLAMLSIYLVTVIYTRKDPYNDREFLMIFNVVLVGVMAIILFAVAETPNRVGNKWGIIMLLALSVVTIVLNSIALSAILFRITEWGVTPNRMAILGSNLLILTHLFLVSVDLLGIVRGQTDIDKLTRSLTWFLPAYGCWAAFVVFGFPLFFGI